MEQLFKDLSDYPWSVATLKVWAEGDFRCTYCGLDMLGSLDNFKLAQVDHLLPQGPYPQLIESPSNHVLTCWVCNKLKRHWDANTRTGEPVFLGGDELSPSQRTELIRRAHSYVTAMRSEKMQELLVSREAVESYRARRIIARQE